MRCATSTLREKNLPMHAPACGGHGGAVYFTVSGGWRRVAVLFRAYAVRSALRKGEREKERSEVWGRRGPMGVYL